MKPIETTAIRTERTAEERGLRTFFRDAEKAIMDRAGEKYGDRIEPERLAWERGHPASLETRRDFERAYKSRNGENPETNVVGFYDDAECQAHVRIEKNDDIAGTIAHEHMHGLVNPESSRTIPSPVVEGIVENYARKITQHEPEPGDLAAYEPEVRAVRSVEHLGGADAIERAAFKGDSEALRQAVDDALRRARSV